MKKGILGMLFFLQAKTKQCSRFCTVVPACGNFTAELLHKETMLFREA